MIYDFNNVRIVFFASLGSAISKNTQRPKPPWLLIVGVASVYDSGSVASIFASSSRHCR
jgi:hypothetical protein